MLDSYSINQLLVNLKPIGISNLQQNLIQLPFIEVPRVTVTKPIKMFNEILPLAWRDTGEVQWRYGQQLVVLDTTINVFGLDDLQRAFLALIYFEPKVNMVSHDVVSLFERVLRHTAAVY